MDLYRYFHPHFNPRLRNVPVRLQELLELQQAATELRKAIERAELRAESCNSGALHSDYLSEIAAALNFASDALGEIIKAQPEDDVQTMVDMLEERKDAPGWESWSRLFAERVKLLTQYDLVPS